MNTLSLMAGLLAVSLIAGCQLLPDQNTAPPIVNDSDQCLETVPSLADSDCLLEAWVDFGLAAQRGDDAWREDILERASGEDKRARLARAVVYTWSDDRSDWEQASELFKADLAAAPSQLQPLLRQWLNGLEVRRDLAGALARSESSRRQLVEERDELAEKLDALTAIEQSINSRDQAP